MLCKKRLNVKIVLEHFVDVIRVAKLIERFRRRIGIFVFFKLRYEIGNQFDQTTVLTYDGKELRIISVNEVDEYKREVVVIANERTD